MSDDIKQLIVKRTQILNAIGRIRKYVEQYNPDRDSVNQLKARHPHLQDAFKDFDKVQCQIELLEDTREQAQFRDTFETRYYDLAAMMLTLIDRKVDPMIPPPSNMPMRRNTLSNHRFNPMAMSSPPEPNFDVNPKSIFVFNLEPDIEDTTLWSLFGPYGAVQSVKIIRDLNTMKCKGFGFVTMLNPSEATLAVQNLNGYILNHRTLQVSFKTNKQRSNNSQDEMMGH